jgi:hypothetical protein
MLTWLWVFIPVAVIAVLGAIVWGSGVLLRRLHPLWVMWTAASMRAITAPASPSPSKSPSRLGPSKNTADPEKGLSSSAGALGRRPTPPHLRMLQPAGPPAAVTLAHVLLTPGRTLAPDEPPRPIHLSFPDPARAAVQAKQRLALAKLARERERDARTLAIALPGGLSNEEVERMGVLDLRAEVLELRQQVDQLRQAERSTPAHPEGSKRGRQRVRHRCLVTRSFRSIDQWMVARPAQMVAPRCLSCPKTYVVYDHV